MSIRLTMNLEIDGAYGSDIQSSGIRALIHSIAVNPDRADAFLKQESDSAGWLGRCPFPAIEGLKDVSRHQSQ
ncbi:hypothetical protein NLO98_04560 [Pseudomonas syringae]|nr:hypothetical protein [Pseudomonas syringae]MCQ2999029.1 hypothetical protein [Pseudomonas syringae]